MRLKLPASRFLSLARTALQFVAKGAALEPGLGLVRLDVGRQAHLRLTAQDQVVGARVLGDQAYEGREGTVAVSGHQLDRLAAIVPDAGDLELTADGERLRARAGRMVVDLPLRPVEDLVPMPKRPKDGWFPVSGPRLADVARRCHWAVAEGDARPTLAGINLSHRCSQACDGYKFAYLTPGLLPEDQEDIIVPTASWQSLRALFAVGDNLQMRVETNRLWLQGPNWVAYTLLVAGKYPDTTPLLAGGIMHSIHVNRHELLSIVRHIGASSIDRKETKMGAGVCFDYRDDGLHLVARHTSDAVASSIQVDEIANWAEGSVTEGEPAGFDNLRHVDFYHEYLKRALDSMPSDVISVMWGDGVDIGGMPLQLRDEEGVVAMVMPRRL